MHSGEGGLDVPKLRKQDYGRRKSPVLERSDQLKAIQLRHSQVRYHHLGFKTNAEL